MLSLRFLPASLISFLCVISSGSAVMASNLSDGIRAYDSGKFADSLVFFEKEVAAHPDNVTAHYYLANSLAASHRNREAVNEYETTLKLEPNGRAAKFCRMALDNFAGASSGLTVGGKAPETAKAQGAVAGTETSSKSQPQQSTASISPGESSTKISVTTVGQETEFEKEANQRVTRINREAAERVKALEVERDAQLLPYNYGKYGQVPQATSVTAPIKADYQRQIDTIKRYAREESDAALIEAKQRSIALEDAAIDLHKASAGGESSSVRLVPGGTNLYMRNYKTESAPSGNPVALIAPPTKALKKGNLQ